MICDFMKLRILNFTNKLGLTRGMVFMHFPTGFGLSQAYIIKMSPLSQIDDTEIRTRNVKFPAPRKVHHFE